MELKFCRVLSSSLPSFSGSRLVTFLFAGSEFCNWFSLFVSLYDPGPLIALSSLGTKGFRRPYITVTRLPELRVLQPRSWRWVWVWTGGICLETQISLLEFSETFGCLRRSGSKADWDRRSQHYFLLISSPIGPDPWVTLVCMFVRSPCLHTMTVVHAVSLSPRKLPPWWGFFALPRAQACEHKVGNCPLTPELHHAMSH